MGLLDGRTALITGGARGQGRSHALTLAREGCDVILVDLCRQLETVPYAMSTPELLQATVAEVEELDRRAIGIEADARDLAGMQAAVARGVSEFGKLDFAVINHGIWSFGGPTHELSEALWDEMIDVNLKGVWIALKAVIPPMLDRGFGRIVVTSSMVTHGGMGYMAHYNASKYGVNGLVNTVAVELADKGITCNAVLPTNVNSPMIRHPVMYKLMAQGGYTKQNEGVDAREATVEDAIPGYSSIMAMPIPWVEPEDISGAVLYLLSDAARYITGVELPVNGGFNRGW